MEGASANISLSVHNRIFHCLAHQIMFFFLNQRNRHEVGEAHFEEECHVYWFLV